MTNADESKVTRPTAEAGAVEPVACVSRGALANVGSGQKVYLYTPEDFHQEADDLIYDQSAIDTLRAQLEAAEAERDRWYAQSELHKHMVITCGVAATHSDPNLTLTGAYKEKWNSQQADSVRALRARAEAAEAEVARYQKALEEINADGDGDYYLNISANALAARTKEAAP